MKISVEKIIFNAAEQIETNQTDFSCNAIYFPGYTSAPDRKRIRTKYEEFLGDWWPWPPGHFEKFNDTKIKNQRVLMLLLFLETYEEFFGEAG